VEKKRRSGGRGHRGGKDAIRAPAKELEWEGLEGILGHACEYVTHSREMSRSVQRAFVEARCFPSDGGASVCERVAAELRPELERLSCDRFGNYVVAEIVREAPALGGSCEAIARDLAALEGLLKACVTHERGCRVVERVVETFGDDEAFMGPLLDYLRRNMSSLLRSKFASYIFNTLLLRPACISCEGVLDLVFEYKECAVPFGFFSYTLLLALEKRPDALGSVLEIDYLHTYLSWLSHEPLLRFVLENDPEGLAALYRRAMVRMPRRIVDALRRKVGNTRVDDHEARCRPEVFNESIGDCVCVH
jgi:hypothetical protein